MEITVKDTVVKVVYPCLEIPEFKSKLLGIDIETTRKHEHPLYDHPKAGLDPYLTKISLLQIYDPAVKTVYVFDVVNDSFWISSLFPTFLAHDWIAHNAKFELSHLTKAGAEFPNSINCTMLMSQLVGGLHNPREEETEDELDTPEGEKDGMSAYKTTSHSLEACSIRWLGIAPDKQHQKSDWNKRPLDEEQIKYAALDTVLTYDLFCIFVKILKKHEMLEIYKLQKKALLPIMAMETNGIAFDWDAHSELIKKWEQQFSVVRIKAIDIFGNVNLASNKQMAEWLQNTLPDVVDVWPKTPKGAPSFTATSLADFRHYPQIECLFEWKRLNKLLTTYGKKFQENRHPITQRIHTGFTLGQTATGRMSSRSPNLQNLPRDKEVRKCFVAPKGKVLVVADFSQIELRIQAEISGDPVMLDAFSKKQDIYKVLASTLYGVPIEEITKNQRTLGKVALLSLGYGTGARKLRSTARSVYNLELDEAQAYQAHATYHQTFYRYSNWCDEVRNSAEHLGTAKSLMGKVRRIDADRIYTTAPNHIIQGSAVELMLLALIKAYEAGLHLSLCVHDELIVTCAIEEAEEVCKKLSAAMNDAMKELFPSAVDYHVADAFSGENWATAKH